MPSDAIFHQALSKLLVEIFNGPPAGEAYILNPGDPGLLAQLDMLDAKAASSRPMPGKTTIAAHVDHILFGLTLLNRWSAGEEDPWADADWQASWKRTSVDEPQWQSLRAALRREAETWKRHVAARTDWFRHCRRRRPLQRCPRRLPPGGHPPNHRRAIIAWLLTPDVTFQEALKIWIRDVDRLPAPP